MAEASGLAGRIRASTESDQFDLAGYSGERCIDLAKAAFSEPLPLSNMVRLSFVVGGGKQCRQKYSDELPKDFCNALGAAGLDEDNAAACEMSCAGRYKYQHDTSKNLKFVHVFPNVAPPANEQGEGGEEEAEPVKRSPPEVLAMCSLDDFRRLLAERVPAYAQRRRLLDELRSRVTKLEAAEKKLIARQALEQSEQALYDELSLDELREKMKIMTDELQAMCDGGQLTADERAQVMDQLASKLADLDRELKKAEADGKAKLKQKLEEQRDKLLQTRTTVSDAAPIALPSLRFASQVQKLHVQLTNLERLEKNSAGHYTMDELKRLGEKPELQEAIDTLKERSRMWFESDDEFEKRVQKCLREAAPKKAAAKASGYNASAGGWSTVGATKGRGGGRR